MTPNPAPSSAAPDAAETSILEAILGTVSTERPTTPDPASPVVGEVVDDRHPTLIGRYLIRYPEPDGRTSERWLASLYGLPVRTYDRVLLVRPGNWPEPVVIGVLDGFARRPEAPAAVGAALELRPDEVVRVQGSRGEPLVEVRQHATGPVVRLLTDDVNLELPGNLKLAAKSIDLRANLGAVNIAATDDVNVTGEVINLN